MPSGPSVTTCVTPMVCSAASACSVALAATSAVRAVEPLEAEITNHAHSLAHVLTNADELRHPDVAVEAWWWWGWSRRRSGSGCSSASNCAAAGSTTGPASCVPASPTCTSRSSTAPACATGLEIKPPEMWADHTCDVPFRAVERGQRGPRRAARRPARCPASPVRHAGTGHVRRRVVRRRGAGATSPTGTSRPARSTPRSNSPTESSRCDGPAHRVHVWGVPYRPDGAGHAGRRRAALGAVPPPRRPGRGAGAHSRRVVGAYRGSHHDPRHPRRLRPAAKPTQYRVVPATLGLLVEDRASGFCGDVVKTMPARSPCATATAATASSSSSPAASCSRASRSRSCAPRVASRSTRHAGTASGSVAAATKQRARLAAASRIWVEGKHDAELVEHVWGDDLRELGIVVEPMHGLDDVVAMVREFQPGADRGWASSSTTSSPAARRTASRSRWPARMCWSPATRSSTCGPGCGRG